jgi:hypothetical protein
MAQEKATGWQGNGVAEVVDVGVVGAFSIVPWRPILGSEVSTPNLSVKGTFGAASFHWKGFWLSCMRSSHRSSHRSWFLSMHFRSKQPLMAIFILRLIQ